MRTHLILLGLLLVLLLPFTAFATVPADLGKALPSKIDQPGSSDGARDTREGGESFGDALVIPNSPYSDTGATCDNADDITLPCANSSAPDVVYRYTPPYDTGLNVSLCGSGYDTALGIYDQNLVNIACNDDACGLQSELDTVPVTAGQTYYIVVDGYSTNCGSYTLTVTETPGPCVSCPPGTPQEGEPPCEGAYTDSYNGGCQTCCWTPLVPLEGNCGSMCGKSCTYLTSGGLSYRDTDWYVAVAEGGPVTVTCTAEFPLQLILIYGADCNNLQYALATGGACAPVSLTWDIPADTEFWVWVGPSVFSGIPESNYLLEVCGIRNGGACCHDTYCILGSEDACRENGRWLGWDTDCDPYPCLPDPPGACCFPDLSCQIVAQSECAQAQGTYEGAGTDCEPNPCQPVPVNSTTWGSIKNRYR